MMNPRSDKSYKAQFVVVRDAATSLLGARTIQQMQLATVHHENIMVAEVYNTSQEPHRSEDRQRDNTDVTNMQLLRQYCNCRVLCVDRRESYYRGNTPRYNAGKESVRWLPLNYYSDYCAGAVPPNTTPCWTT